MPISFRLLQVLLAIRVSLPYLILIWPGRLRKPKQFGSPRLLEGSEWTEIFEENATECEVNHVFIFGPKPRANQGLAAHPLVIAKSEDRAETC